MPVDTSLMSGPEKLFYDELNAIGATVHGCIIRAPRDWLHDLYGFQVTRSDGSQVAGYLPWNVSTYPQIIAIAKGA